MKGYPQNQGHPYIAMAMTGSLIVGLWDGGYAGYLEQYRAGDPQTPREVP